MAAGSAPDLTANSGIVIYENNLAAGLLGAGSRGHACRSCAYNQDVGFDCNQGCGRFTHHSSLVTHHLQKLRGNL